MLLLLGLGSPAAHAQLFTFRNFLGEELTDEDLDLLGKASAKLYENPAVSVGTIETWANPKSGNSGSVELIEIFRAQGMPCRKLRHSIKVVRYSQPRTVEFNRCQLPSGEWKLLSTGGSATPR